MIIKYLTDNDLYKFTTMYAVQKLYPHAKVRYKFFNRGEPIFPEGFADALKNEVEQMATLSLLPEEEKFLREKCYFFDPVFVDLLKGYKYNPDEVKIEQNGGKLDVEIEGYWYRTVLWEVPLLATISELYFKMTGQQPQEVELRAENKAIEFAKMDVRYSEFGTRRRFSFDVHDQVLKTLIKFSGKSLTGTSNVYLAMKNNIKPIGTHPHEWFMFHAAHYGYLQANYKALEHWVEVYRGALGIALTDTFTTDNFFKSFDRKHAKLFDGLRWDSGDALEFTRKALDYYAENNIDSTTKTIVYSDALNLEEVKRIKAFIKDRVRDAYGIGTYLTNDVGVKPLNIVIKLTEVAPFEGDDWRLAIKLSDVKGKHTGDEDEIDLCKRILRIN